MLRCSALPSVWAFYFTEVCLFVCEIHALMVGECINVASFLGRRFVHSKFNISLHSLKVIPINSWCFLYPLFLFTFIQYLVK